MANVLLLLIGSFYSFFLPGFLLIEAITPKMRGLHKLPLYIVFSVIVSSVNTYLFGLFFGFSEISVLLSIMPFLCWLYLWLKKEKDFLFDLRGHTFFLTAAVGVFALFFVSLYPGIFEFHKGSIVMSGPNWQDTAMHLSIIESISQGNFPPQAPYFSGHSLSYYYFTDFHTAISSVLYSNFFPKILVFENSFYAFTFFMAIYSLTFFLTKKKTISLLSATLATFYSGLGFSEFFLDIWSLRTKPLIENMLNLLSSRGYDLNGEFFKVVSVTNYFLQNRPMMVGLSAVASAIYLVLYGFEKRNLKVFWLAGIITGAMVKFQLFALVSTVFFFAVSFVLYLARSFKKRNWERGFFARLFLVFFTPTLAFYLLFGLQNVGDRQLVEIFIETFSFGPWAKMSLDFAMKFVLLNLGFPLLISLVFPVFYTGKPGPKYLSLYTFLIVLFLSPFLFGFTIFKMDMFKFFYISFIPASVLCSAIVDSFRKKQHRIALSLFLLISTCLTSILVLSWSFLSKSTAYSFSGYKAGQWMRDNTPRLSVFAALPTVHSPVTDIAGRLRVVSYINWPYSHGFNTGEDNVFKRVEDMEKIYEAKDVAAITGILEKYGVKYVYYGEEEKNKFPGAGVVFERLKNFKKVYEEQNIAIFKII